MANIDVEMGQFQKVTTLENKDYIVVSLDNGTQGQIKVSDLASVVAGVLGNPLGYQGPLVSGTDFDNVTDNGYYQILYAMNYLNAPCKEGALIVINVSYFIIQIVIGSMGYGAHYRSKWGSSGFTGWNKIAIE